MIQIAEEVFASRGYAAASMDDIAERVGVSKPMLYEYFRSKEGLLAACIAQSRTELREATELAVAGAPSAEEALRRGLRAFFDFVRERRRAWSLLRHEGSLIGTSVWAEIEVIRQQHADLIVKSMADHFETGSLLRVEAAAEFMVGACERLAIWCERNDEVTPEQATNYAMEILWKGLSGRVR
ncbi:TetR/AcrR family transcriptional regulator [Amycolatopsis taiwanensis]|nr:TetR/AcrR family transcriptional regulator [Amycolatopsis taiwanensis]